MGSRESPVVVANVGRSSLIQSTWRVEIRKSSILLASAVRLVLFITLYLLIKENKNELVKVIIFRSNRLVERYEITIWKITALMLKIRNMFSNIRIDQIVM